MTDFPIDPLLVQICQQIKPGSTLLLQAPPGAGKTTRVPLALIGALAPVAAEITRSGRVLMVEPRRLATRAAASRLAQTLDEPLGQRIGYAMRGEQKRSAKTQVEVITDGLFLRRLQADPSLEGVSCVLFDEFHERRKDADLALALLREAVPVLRPDLALVLMSATLDLSDLRERLPQADVLESAGRCYPVETHHQRARENESLPRQVLRALENHALTLPQGSGALVFLPGLREIERCRTLLSEAHALQRWRLAVLHGQLPLDSQSAALRRCGPDHDGTVILASGIAESSITIDGVRLVIDRGLSRQLRYDPNTGMEGLETVPSSLASAAQRRGRAGRQTPGQCVRLWSPAEQQRRPNFNPPELLLADPQPILMELAQWGAGVGKDLPWLDPPPQAAMQEGLSDLQALGLLQPNGQLSPLGRQVSTLGVHPRLGLLMLEARKQGCSQLGCDLAALLSERDPLAGRDAGSDLEARLSVVGQHRTLRERSRQLHQQLERLGPPALDNTNPANAAELVVRAFPQWLAQERPGQPGRYLLRQGRGAVLPPQDPLRGCPALAVARVDTGGRDTVIQLALPLDPSILDKVGEREGTWIDHVSWDASRQQVKAERRLQLGDLVLRRTPQSAPSPEQCQALLLNALHEASSLEALPWTAFNQQLRQRLSWMHHHYGPPWPPRDRETLLRDTDWLAPTLLGCQSWRDVSPAMLEDALWGELSWTERQRLDHVLPERIAIPSGRQATLRYDDEEVVLPVKLQEMFGEEQGPHVLEGRVPVTLELLSPAGRSLQRTRDLEGFWKGSYADVRREMRGRYPKHPWPDDPSQATPTAFTKRKQQQQQG